MEATLIVIGLNHRSAGVAVRERYWMSESRRNESLATLSKAEGIDELVMVGTCARTEFLVWANDASSAANSVLHLLTEDYGLKLCEWKNFYRLIDEGALVHIFRAVCGLDSIVLGDPQIAGQVKDAWQQAQRAGTTGRFLDAVLQKALSVSERVRNEILIGVSGASIPNAAMELARQILGTVAGKKVLLLGAGNMSQLFARAFANNGTTSITVANRTLDRAIELAAKVGGTASVWEERWRHLAEADIVISSTSCPRTILDPEDAELIARRRKAEPLVIVDAAVPRDIDPHVREIKGIFVYDLDDLEQIVKRNAGEVEAEALEAEKIVLEEVQGFRSNLLAKRMVPTVVALRHRLDEICRQELESFREEYGPFSKDQNQLYAAVTSRITLKIAGVLARELKELPEQVEQCR